MIGSVIALMVAAAAPATAGQCAFDRASLSFAGSAREQANCLLRHVAIGGQAEAQAVPDALLDRVGTAFAPRRSRLRAVVRGMAPDAARDLLNHLHRPLSRTEAGVPAAYFVIHDTSTPYLGEAEFPVDLDGDARVNDFAPYRAAEPVAHLFVNRRGEVVVGHDVGEGWRAPNLSRGSSACPRADGSFMSNWSNRAAAIPPTSTPPTTASRPIRDSAKRSIGRWLQPIWWRARAGASG